MGPARRRSSPASVTLRSPPSNRSGHYAIRIVFDDRHDSGIFSWSDLRELGDSYAERWAAYQAALLYRGLSRDKLSLS